MATPTFSAGGLISGLDTNSIVDQLTALESKPLDLLRKRQSAFKQQISQLGDLASKLSALKTAADNLSRNGVLGATTTSTNTAFSATPGVGAIAGRYSVEVTEMAVAAKRLSQAYGSATAPVTGGTLNLTVQGKAYDPITIGDGAALSDVALAINQSGAPVSASVISDGTSYFLSITNKDTGHTIGEAPATALSVTMNSTGSQGQALTTTEIAAAKNAKLNVDGINNIERTSNTISDIIPGVTLTLKAKSASAGVPEDLVIASDPTATSNNLQKFVTAYNDVMKLVQSQLAVAQGTDRTTTLAGDSAVRSLQGTLQSLMTNSLPGNGTVRALADVGIKTNRDGTLTLDSATLNSAISRDPSAIDALFSTATDGVAAKTSALVDRYTNVVDGMLVNRQNGLKKSITQMDGQADALQRRIDSFRENLVAQFTAMERALSGFKSIGNFLTQQEKQKAT